MQCSHGRAVSRLSAGAGVTGVNGGDLLRVVKDEICRFGPWPDQMITRNTINLNRKKKQAEIDVKEVSEYKHSRLHDGCQEGISTRGPDPCGRP